MVWCEVLGQFEDGAFIAVNFVLGVCGGKNGKEETFDADRRLDDVWDKCLISDFIAVDHRFAGLAFDIHEVKVSAVGKAHKLLCAIWVIKHEVDGAFGIVSAVFGGDFELVDFIMRESDDFFEEFVLEGAHGLEICFPGGGIDEIFDFHLATFTVA